MPALLGLILPALLPVLADGAKGIFNFFTGGATAEPANMDERIKLMGAELETLKALAALDQPSPNISLWVADLRASFRYIAAGLIVLGGLVGVGTVLFIDATAAPFVNSYLQGVVGPVFSFMFGQRMYLSLRGRK